MDLQCASCCKKTRGILGIFQELWPRSDTRSGSQFLYLYLPFDERAWSCCCPGVCVGAGVGGAIRAGVRTCGRAEDRKCVLWKRLTIFLFLMCSATNSKTSGSGSHLCWMHIWYHAMWVIRRRVPTEWLAKIFLSKLYWWDRCLAQDFPKHMLILYIRHIWQQASLEENWKFRRPCQLQFKFMKKPV